MRRLSLTLASLIALVVAVSALAPAAAGEPRHRGFDRLRQHLALTDDQVTSLHQIYARHADARRQLAAQIRDARRDVRDLAVKGGDAATLEARTADLEKLLGQALRIRVTLLQEIAPVLTPEQREKFALLRAGFHRHHGHRPGQQS